MAGTAEQYILKTMPWDHQPHGELVQVSQCTEEKTTQLTTIQRIRSRLTPKRGWKFLDSSSKEQFDRFREHHKKLHKDFVFPGFEAMHTEAEKEWMRKAQMTSDTSADREVSSSTAA